MGSKQRRNDMITFNLDTMNRFAIGGGYDRLLNHVLNYTAPSGNGGDGYSTNVKTKKCPPNKKCDVEKQQKKGHLSLKGFNLKIS